jgi:DNA polymerase (family 10)
VTNAELAQKLRDLRDFLIIAGYEESHATRYTHIARNIEKWPESVEQMRKENRLKDLPQVGPLIAQYIREIIDDGVSSKQKEWEPFAPISVLELVKIPGLGPKTAALMYHGHGIADLKTLKQAQDAGILDTIPGLGPKLQETIRRWLEAEGV